MKHYREITDAWTYDQLLAEGIVGGITREEFERGTLTGRHFGYAADAHVGAGGCGGDVCPRCNGTGIFTAPGDPSAICLTCNGSGMGK